MIYLNPTRCTCKSYKVVRGLDPRNFTPPTEYAQTLKTKQTERQRECDLEYQHHSDKVLHPTNVVLEVFRKTFQILDVLCKSELPVLV